MVAKSYRLNLKFLFLTSVISLIGKDQISHDKMTKRILHMNGLKQKIDLNYFTTGRTISTWYKLQIP